PHHSSCDTSVSSLVVQRPPSSPLFPYTTLFRSWLTVPDVPILPPWARSAASLRANAVALGRLCAWHTRYHLLRTPKYAFRVAWRSEEHTSELQSRANLVCRLLLEKQKYKDEVTG